MNVKTVSPVSKRTRRAFMLSTTIALWFLIYLEFRSNHCLVFMGDLSSAVLGCVALWILSVSFFLLGWRGRVILFVCLTAVYLIRPRGFGSRIAAIQASTASHLRTMHSELEAYKNEHPSVGYPASMPNTKFGRWNVARYYRFEYTPIRSVSNGPADDFILQATPIRRSCGFEYNFTIFGDGQLHGTIQGRPATRNDKVLGP